MADPKEPVSKKIVDIEIWFNTQTGMLLLGSEEGPPIDKDTGYLTNRFFSTLVLRLKTCGERPLKTEMKTLDYDWPSDRLRKKMAKRAVFPYHALTWVTPDSQLVLPQPSNLNITHGNAGTTLVINDLNVFTGWKEQVLKFYFMISVFYQGKLFTTDPVVINEPYIPEDGSSVLESSLVNASRMDLNQGR